MSRIENCGNCGGTHYGSGDCPYLEKNMGEPCTVCAERTSYCCSDCAIDGAGKVYVCINDACRSAHEQKHPKPDSAALALFHQAWGYAKEHSNEIEGGYDKAAFGHVQFWLSKVQP